jgi:hypothetical protein
MFYQIPVGELGQYWQRSSKSVVATCSITAVTGCMNPTHFFEVAAPCKKTTTAVK